MPGDFVKMTVSITGLMSIKAQKFRIGLRFTDGTSMILFHSANRSGWKLSTGDGGGSKTKMAKKKLLPVKEKTTGPLSLTGIKQNRINHFSCCRLARNGFITTGQI